MTLARFYTEKCRLSTAVSSQVLPCNVVKLLPMADSVSCVSGKGAALHSQAAHHGGGIVVSISQLSLAATSTSGLRNAANLLVRIIRNLNVSAEPPVMGVALGGGSWLAEVLRLSASAKLVRIDGNDLFSTLR